jgi:CheY-like chemotaxis protein/glycine cleavage system H lipoate-binding protein
MERPLNILVIDDEQIVLDSVQKHLRKENFVLHMVLSVARALEHVDETPPDIILTDLMMPDTDGMQLLGIIKERAPQIPVIMITGYATINTALQATNLGAFDYVAKPFTKSELVSVVKRAAELVRAGATQSGKREQDTSAGADTTIEPDSAATIGEYGWNKIDDDGTVLLGARPKFLKAVGQIQTIFLPAKGDELRLGSVYLRIFSADHRSYSVLSPFSGEVLAVNDRYQTNPTGLPDCSEDEWLVRLKPSKLELEIGELGL